jgi:hypothetical protein
LFDLGLEGGTVVTAAGRARANVYVSGGRIASVGADREPARERIDADGLLVMPGMVDAHVHFMDPSATDREDFATGSAAAARAGVTTVVEHTHSGPVRTAAELRDKAAYLAGRSRVDFALGAHAWPGMAGEVAPLWRAGAAFMKAFTCTTHGVPGHSPADLLALFQAVAAAGATCLVHCEEESLTAAAERALRASGRQDGGVIPAWRSREAELVAVATAAQLAASAAASVVVAHASNPLVPELARPACLVETCPQYLTLFEGEAVEAGALRKFTPPARPTSRPGRRHRLRLLRPRPGHAGPEARRVDLGRPLRPARDRHHVLGAAGRSPRRPADVRAGGGPVLGDAGPYLRPPSPQGQPGRGRGCRPLGGGPGAALDGPRRGRGLEGRLVAVRRPHVHRPDRQDVAARPRPRARRRRLLERKRGDRYLGGMTGSRR